MSTYYITCEVQEDADTPEQAAKQAWMSMKYGMREVLDVYGADDELTEQFKIEDIDRLITP